MKPQINKYYMIVYHGENVKVVCAWQWFTVWEKLCRDL